MVDFLRFENLDADPDCGDLEITLLTPDEQSLRFPIAGHPERSLVQEPSIVELPDGRLFAVMRSVSGHPVCAQSRDGGEHWSRPEILTYGDGLPPLAHPLSPCPCYRLNETEYLLFFHNHGADFGPWRNHDGRGRRPIYLSLGRFAPGDGQPLRFSAPISLMDSDNVELNRRSDLALYSSFEEVDGPAGALLSRPQALSGRPDHRPRAAGQGGLSVMRRKSARPGTELSGNSAAAPTAPENRPGERSRHPLFIPGRGAQRRPRFSSSGIIVWAAFVVIESMSSASTFSSWSSSSTG